MSARIFQHENEHMNGYIFTDLVSKMKLERGKKAQAKLIKQTIRRQQQRLYNEVKEKNYLNTASALIKQSIHEMEIFVEHLKGKKEKITEELVTIDTNKYKYEIIKLENKKYERHLLEIRKSE